MAQIDILTENISNNNKEHHEIAHKFLSNLFSQAIAKTKINNQSTNTVHEQQYLPVNGQVLESQNAMGLIHRNIEALKKKFEELQEKNEIESEIRSLNENYVIYLLYKTLERAKENQ